MSNLVFAFDNNHYDGYCGLMTREAFDAWQAEDTGESPFMVPVESVVGGAEALARGETSGTFALVEDSTPGCQCQSCGELGVEMFDICTKCGWENDFSLEDSEGNLHDVGFVLTPEERTWTSMANHGECPNDPHPFTSNSGAMP